MSNNKLSGLSKLSDLSKGASKKTAGIMIVHPDELYSVEQVRRGTDITPEKIDELAEAILENGQSTPCVVYPKDKNGYRIHNGECRWRAIKKNNGQEIKIGVDESLNLIEHDGEMVMDRKAYISQASDNINRENLSPFAIAAWIEKALLPPYEMKKSGIAKYFGKGNAWVSRHVKLIGSPLIIEQLYIDGKMKDAETLSQLVKLFEQDQAECERLISEERYQRQWVQSALSKIKARKEHQENEVSDDTGESSEISTCENSSEENQLDLDELDDSVNQIIKVWEDKHGQFSSDAQKREAKSKIIELYNDYVIDVDVENKSVALKALYMLVEEVDIYMPIPRLSIEHLVIIDKLIKEQSSENDSPYVEYIKNIVGDDESADIEQMCSTLAWAIETIDPENVDSYLEEKRDVLTKNSANLNTYSELIALLADNKQISPELKQEQREIEAQESLTPDSVKDDEEEEPAENRDQRGNLRRPISFEEINEIASFAFSQVIDSLNLNEQMANEAKEKLETAIGDNVEARDNALSDFEVTFFKNILREGCEKYADDTSVITRTLLNIRSLRAYFQEEISIAMYGENQVDFDQQSRSLRIKGIDVGHVNTSTAEELIKVLKETYGL